MVLQRIVIFPLSDHRSQVRMFNNIKHRLSDGGFRIKPKEVAIAGFKRRILISSSRIITLSWMLLNTDSRRVRSASEIRACFFRDEVGAFDFPSKPVTHTMSVFEGSFDNIHNIVCTQWRGQESAYTNP